MRKRKEESRKSFLAMATERVMRALGLLSAALMAIHFLPINTTPSMPYGIYLRLPAWNIEVGNIVELDNPMESSLWGINVRHGLLKRVERIDGELYWVEGEHPKSYDSRFFGAVGKEYITHKMVPLATTRHIPDWLSIDGGQESKEEQQID